MSRAPVTLSVDADQDGALVAARDGSPLAPEGIRDDRLFYEINLLKLEGILFCLDKKEASKRTGTTDLSAYLNEPFTITPHPTWGYPSVLACRVNEAIMRKLSEYGEPIPNYVSFSRRELAALVGRSSFGGKDSKELFRALKQLQTTDISARFFDKKTGRWALMSFMLIPELLVEGRGDTVNSCMVRLHPLIIDSLRDRHFACFNFARMEPLDLIGRQLFKRLFFHFSNLRERPGKEISFRKDYGDICRAWLGGLKELRFASKIEQEQLGRHLRGLKKVGLIKSYEISRNADEDGFNISFAPGKGFFEDYERFYGKDRQASFQFSLVQDDTDIRLPLELLAYFYKRLHGVETLSPTVFSQKETEFARQLLRKMTIVEAQDLADYAIEQAPRTKFEIKSFGAVRQYVDAWRGAKERGSKIAAARASQEAKAREERLREQYDRHIRHMLIKYRDTFSADQLAALEAEVRKEAALPSYQPDSIGERIQNLQVHSLVDARLLERLSAPSFDEWKGRLQG